MPVTRLMLAMVLAGAVISQRAPRVAAEPLPPAPAWQLTCVDCPKLFGALTDRGLRLDTAGHPHIAYGGDHLYYATHDGSTWRYETVDGSSGVGSAASLALDAAGRPVISYYDALNQDLKFAYRDGAGWHTETVDSGGAVGAVTALDLDANGRAHIAYIDSTHQTLKYARRTTSGWQLEQIGATNRQFTALSMDADSAGVPHVAYYAHTVDASSDDLMYARRSAAGWTVETAVPNAGYLWSCSLALDSANRPHIAFPASGRQSKIAHWTGVAWQIEALSWGGDEPNYFSLAIGAGDYPHISAMVIMQYEPTSWVVAHQYKDAAGWHSTGGFGTIHSAGQTSLALDAAGRPTIGHVGGDNLVLSVLAGATWQSQGVDVSRNVGRLTSLALDGSGRPVIAYSPGRIAAWTGGTWTFDNISTSGEPTGISLALGRNGQPHVAYSWYWSLEIFEEAGIDYVYRDGAGWHRTALFHGGQSARAGPPALALDASDAPQVSGGVYGLPSSPPYEPALTITHFRRTSSGWTSEIVEGPSDWAAPRAVSLDLDANGNPVIGYIAPQGEALKVASFSSASGWRYEVVDPAGGEGLSLAVDAVGQPRLSYSRSGRLKYAARDPGGWRIVDVAAGNFAETSLALDANGYPHISAYDAANADLVYAWRDAAGWHVEGVDSHGAVGQGASLALNAAGQAVISYYDASNGDLKLAVRQWPKAGSAAHTRVPPTVDGNLADWPALPEVLVDTWNALDYGGLISSAADASARCSYQWTPTHLYAACRIDDDALVADSGAQWWKDDTVELVYDGLNDNQSNGADDHKFEMRIDGGFSDYTLPAHPSVAFALRTRPGGYNVELAVPTAQLGGIPMQAGRVIGLNIGLIDDDTGGDADGWLGWSGNTYRRADLCGDLLLLPAAPQMNQRYLPLILRH